jgi:hypothetical protein
MILEYAQLLSTAHRVVDSEEVIKDKRNDSLYKATHVNHPSSLWVRQSAENYHWLYSLWVNLMDEYTHRYNKTHKSSRLKDLLLHPPSKIKVSNYSTPFLAMPKVYHNKCAVTAYRDYYVSEKSHLFSWKNRDKPLWLNV